MFFNREIKASARNVPSELTLSGEFEIAAAEGDNNDAPVKFLLTANSGKPMKLEGFFDPVVIAIDGAKFDKKVTPVIADHDTSKRIGHTLEQVIVPHGATAKLNGKMIKGPMIAAIGQASSKMGVAQGFVEDAKAGFPFQVSVGAKIIDGYFVEPGETATVNGKNFKGPLIVSAKTLIRELTITVLGADNNTSARIAASEIPISSRKETTVMNFEAFVASLGLDINAMSDEQKDRLKAHWGTLKSNPTGNNTDPPNDPPPIQSGNGGNDIEATERERRQRMAREEQRVDAIRATSQRFEGLVPEKFKVGETEYTLATLKAHAIEEGWNVDQFELHCLRNERPEIGGTFAIHANDRNIDNEALQASIMRQFALAPMREKNRITGEEYGIECMFKDEALEASHRPEYDFGGSIQALLDMQIRAAGMHYPGSSRKGSDFVATAVRAWEHIRASGFSTLSITNVLENTMHKTSLAAFQSVESLWRFLCGRKALNDFRPHNMYRLTEKGAFRQVSPTGELKHIGMTDQKYSISADTYGAIITIDRKTMKNDDLGLVLEQARAIGSLGGQRIEESVFVLLLSNPETFYSAGNGNLITDVLGVDGLTTARQSFRNQVNANGKPVGVSPRILLVGTPLEDTANRLWTQETLQAVGSTDDLKFTNNPHRGLYRPYVSPYLNNTNITDQDGNAITGQSDTQWYLFADPSSPQGASLVIGFVDGRDTPYYDEAETAFNVPGGMQFRSYLDWGVGMNVTELSMKSSGAG